MNISAKQEWEGQSHQEETKKQVKRVKKQLVPKRGEKWN